MEKNRNTLNIITLWCILTIVLCGMVLSIKSYNDYKKTEETYTLLPSNIMSVTISENGNWILYSDSIAFPFKRYGEYITVYGNIDDIEELRTLFAKYNTHHNGDTIANTFEIVKTDRQFNIKRCSN